MKIERVTHSGGSFVFSGALSVNCFGVLADLVWVLDAGRDEILDALDGVQFGEWVDQVGEVLDDWCAAAAQELGAG